MPRRFGLLSPSGDLDERVPDGPGVYVWTISQCRNIPNSIGEDDWHDADRLLYIGESGDLNGRIGEYLKGYRAALAAHSKVLEPWKNWDDRDENTPRPQPPHCPARDKKKTHLRVGWRMYEVSQESFQSDDESSPIGTTDIQLGLIKEDMFEDGDFPPGLVS